MKNERSTSERIPPGAFEVVECENGIYRRHRFENAFLAIGTFAAVGSSILRWPLEMRVLSTIFFFVWVLSLTIYSEAYLFFAARSLPEVLSRLRDERKVVKCVLLFLLPSLCRLARILLIALVTK